MAGCAAARARRRSGRPRCSSCSASSVCALLESDDSSSVDDSLIQVALGALGLLGAVLLALLLAGAPVLPCVSALLPPVVIFAIPWRDVHSAAGSTWIWLLCHLLALGWTLARPGGDPSPRRASG